MDKKIKKGEKKKILIICSHNSARSQMAEGIFKALYGNRYEVYSAGTDPLEITRQPKTKKALRNKYLVIKTKKIGRKKC